MIYKLSLDRWEDIYEYLQQLDCENNDYPGSVKDYLAKEYKLWYLHNENDEYQVEDEQLFTEFLLRWS